MSLYLYFIFLICSTKIDFAKKPDITKFDKPFTPSHKSSQRFATHMSSILWVLIFLSFSICSWLAHLVSGFIKNAYIFLLDTNTHPLFIFVISINLLVHYTRGTQKVLIYIEYYIPYTISEHFGTFQFSFAVLFLLSI